MSLIHGDELWFNGNVFVFNRASDSIAEDNDILSLSLFGFSNQDTVLSAGNNLLESPHVFNMLLVNNSVPENDAHILTFWLFESKNKCVVKV
jgi:hypothetical protein